MAKPQSKRGSPKAKVVRAKLIRPDMKPYNPYKPSNMLKHPPGAKTGWLKKKHKTSNAPFEYGKVTRAQLIHNRKPKGKTFKKQKVPK